MGGIFPRGIPIGDVLQLTETEAGWSKSYLVKPRSTLTPREVMVLVGQEADADVFDIRPDAAGDTVP